MKKIGDYIHLVDERNTDLKIDKLLGISMTKEFRPSTSNIIGTDLSTYKIVRPGIFAFDTMSVIRVHKVPIVLNKMDSSIIISPAYKTFEINDTNEVEPRYLDLWFKRDEFDRYGDFKSDAAVRGGYNWEELCDTSINLPPITEQHRIVNEYQTVERRIRNNEALIQKLEETAQAIYYHTFVEGIDEENLPSGWKKGVLSDVADIVMGQSPDGDSYNEEANGTIFYQGRTDFGRRFPSPRMYTTEPTRYAKNGDILMSVRAPVGDLNVCIEDCCIGRGLAAICEKQNRNSYLYYLLQSKESVFKQSDAEGTIFGSINKDDLYGLEIIVPDNKNITVFNDKVKKLDNYIMSLSKENAHLRELLTLLTSKLS